LPRGLPGSRSFLSTNGSHLHEGGVDVPAMRSQHGMDGLQRAKHHAMTHPYQAPATYGLDDLRVEQVGEWHPPRLGCRALRLPAWWLHPLPIVGQQGRQILPKAIREKERGTVGGQDLRD